MQAEHNSFQPFFRSPFGAVPTGTRICLRVMIYSYNVPTQVSLFWGNKELPMYFKESFSTSRVYEIKLTVPHTAGLYWYGFRICADGETKFLGAPADGLGGMGELFDESPVSLWQVTVYRPRKTPKWFQKAVFYQIFPDSFKKGGNYPQKGIAKAWGDQRFYKSEQFGGEYLANDMYGGDLTGVQSALPYLKDLGVSAVYLNPIFESPTNHKYDTSDYEKVDSAFGGNDAFARMVEEGEKTGIRFVLDGVFNHTGSDSRYFNKNGRFPETGAYQSKDSPYYSWYNFEEFPDKYSSWWGFLTLPDTNDSDESFRRYIASERDSIVRRWLRAGASGWRLDVADELSDDFIALIKESASEEKEDAVVIGEVWEDASNKISYGVNRTYFTENELDGVMNYPWKNAIISYVMHKTDAASFVRSVLSLMQHYPPENLYCCLNFLSTHDTERALSVLGGAPEKDTLTREAQAHFSLTHDQKLLAEKRLILAYALLFTLPGAPCIFYGDECGTEGLGDPFNRSAMPWDRTNTGIHTHLKKLAAYRNAHDALSVGEWIPLFGTGTVLCFLRLIQNRKDALGDPAESGAFLAVFNTSETETKTVSLDIGRFHLHCPAVQKVTVGPLGYHIISIE